MIPKTLLSPETGGDGDPLDVIVLGEQLQKGSVVEIKLIGILKMLDNGEIDDKLIAVRVNNSIFSSVTSFNELKKSYQGVIEILEIWFTNYKGSKKIAVRGFENEQKALEIFKSACQQYKNHYDKN
jgi:inorganic pyrophosphatase